MSRSGSFDSAVIGAGIVGASVAAGLAARGQRVVVVDRLSGPAGASRRSLAWLNTASSHDPAYRQLREAGLRFHLLEHARWGSGSPYVFTGSLAWSARGRPAGGDSGVGAVGVEGAGVGPAGVGAAEVGGVGSPEEDVEQRFARLAANGHAVRLVGAAEAARLEPALSRATLDQGPFLVADDEGYVDLPVLVASRLRLVSEGGGEVVSSSRGAELDLAGGRASLSTPETGPVHADGVVVAAGAETPGLLRRVGIELGESTTTGTLVVATDGGVILRRLLLAPSFSARPHGEGRLVVQAPGADLAAGPWTELAATGGLEAVPEVVVALLDEVAATLKVTSPLRAVEIRQGPRPIPGDGFPVVGRVLSTENLSVAFCHSGATLGLALGEYLAAELTGEPASVSLLDPYRPGRLLAPAARGRLA